MTTLRLRSRVALAALPLFCLSVAAGARAATISVVTPGEQNTASSEFECTKMPCAAGRWFYYPEQLQADLGAGYAVQNNGDGGAILGCDATTKTMAGGASFCASQKYTNSLTPTPGIVIIGPFGEHDARIFTAGVKTDANFYTTWYKESVFEAAYEGLVQKYLPLTTKIYMMTPIDLDGKWNLNGDTFAAGKDIVKDVMLPAALKVAQNHSLTVIDTYTELSGTPALVSMYYDADGQENSAGQQKMAKLIDAALASGNGGAGGAGGMGGASGAAGGSAAGAGGTGVTGGGGTGGASAGNGGTGVVTSGAGMGGGIVSAGAGGAIVSAGGAGNSAGAIGVTAGSPSAGAATVTPPSSSSDSGGCAVVATGGDKWNAGLLLAMAGVLGLARRRRQRARN